MDRLKKFKIAPSKSIQEALTAIDSNGEGFLISVENNKVVGILTDGDLRREIIKNTNIQSPIKKIINKNFKFLQEDDFSFDSLAKIFNTKEISFIPIIKKDMTFVNVITKEEFHASLMSDKSLNYDVENDFDLSNIVYEVHSKPWGFYKTTVMTPFHQAKILCINPKQAISLQSHKFREEHWVNVKGKGEVIIDDVKKAFLPGNYAFIPLGSKHRLINTSDRENLIVSEVQLGESFDENDIIRYEDDYGR
tara:strand:- start:997 stop:1746 length:750 start_codon:yes stop_codon:yes gene_type:complete